MQVDQNIIYSASVSGISMQEGVKDSFIRNNLIFNTAQAGIIINNYPGDCASFGQGGSGTICPYDQSGNLFENNTVYQAGTDWTDSSSYEQPAVRVKNDAVGKVGDLGHNTFRNNIFVGYGSYYPPVVYDDDDKDYLSTSTFTDNIH